MKYFVATQNGEKGPYEEEEIRSWLRSDTMPGDALVRDPSDAMGRPASQVFPGDVAPNASFAFADSCFSCQRQLTQDDSLVGLDVHIGPGERHVSLHPANKAERSMHQHDPSSFVDIAILRDREALWRGELDEALLFANQALQVAYDEGDPVRAATSLDLVGDVATRLGENSRACIRINGHRRLQQSIIGSRIPDHRSAWTRQSNKCAFAVVASISVNATARTMMRRTRDWLLLSGWMSIRYQAR